ncbi:MAG: Trk system potassium transporter TrkA [Cellvibrionaceae bacterium]|nr:Trk system potassium transporter TrkA [Cellvibrionaceae bacterium]
MKIIILGAGQVGATLAEHLTREKNDITVIDHSQERLRELRDRLDIRVIHGHASHPDILEEANIEDADLLIAVTVNDEVNMVACQIAYTLYRTPVKIARIRASAYANYKDKLFRDEHSPVDVIISPEQLVSEYIFRLVENPGALQVLDFAEGRIRLVAVKAYHGGPLVGRELRFMRHHMPNIDTRVAAIYRQGEAIVPEGHTVIEADDEVFFIAARENIRAVSSELRRSEKPYKRIMIAGGGNIGLRLAKRIESRYGVKIFDLSHERCKSLSEALNYTVVLQGSASDQDLLLEENIEETDVFIAVTNDDEANIMASLLAKRLGAKKVMALINNSAYVDLIQGGDIDIAISPEQATVGSVLSHVRSGDMVNVHSLRRSAAEAIEVIAHGDKNTSKVVGKTVDEIDLPDGATIGAISRQTEKGQKVIIVHDNTVIENNDHVIVFLVNKRHTKHVEKLFQVGFSFF